MVVKPLQLQQCAPAQTGTVSQRLPDLSAIPSPLSDAPNFVVTIRGEASPITLPNLWDAASKPTTHEELRAEFERVLKREAATASHPALRDATVQLIDDRLRIVAGGTDSNVYLSLALTSDSFLFDGSAENVAYYALGVGDTLQAQQNARLGSDGGPAGALSIRGSRAQKTGLYALENVDLFNLLCIPETAISLSEDAARMVFSEALAYCEQRRAFLFVDLPANINTVADAKQWLTNNATLRSRNAAAYFPHLEINDPLLNGRLRSVPPSGAAAGLFARVDAQRGVWKAPAGTDVPIRGVAGVKTPLSDPENGALNPLGLNCLRNFSVYGNVIWGARTLRGADVLTDEYKYIPVRRTALFIEESLYRGLKWVVFEPNDGPLWATIRLNVGAFMQNLFRQGAFAGRSSREAYLVKCDSETTTENDINLGIVNIIVGFKPLQPAEFVILKIQQLAGQIAT